MPAQDRVWQPSCRWLGTGVRVAELTGLVRRDLSSDRTALLVLAMSLGIGKAVRAGRAALPKSCL
jgi:hypothetical protein